MALTALRPFPKFKAFDSNGNLLAGGKLYTYSAGTTTQLATYTNSSGTVANTNPVILDANGEADVWFQPLNYKLVLKDANDVTIWSQDEYSGSPYPITDEWVTYVHTWTYISATQVSVPGDQTAIYTVNRAIRAVTTGGTYYGTLTASTYDGSTKTTLTVSFDVGSFDSGVAGSSKVSIGVQSNQSPALIAAGSAAASASAAAADAVQTAADRVQTGLDKAATAADRVQTGLDKAATAADRVQTGLDKAATAADRVQTGLDKAATAADRVQTGLDRDAAQSAATSAAATAGATKWVSGSYGEGVAVWSPTDGQTYRRKAPGGASPTDPVADSTNWYAVGSPATLANKTLTNATVEGYTEGVLVAAAGSAFSISLTADTVHGITTNANTTVTLPAPAAGKSFQLQIVYGGAHSITWAVTGGSTIGWPGGTAPTPTSTNGKTDVFNFTCNAAGTKWLGATFGANY